MVGVVRPDVETRLEREGDSKQDGTIYRPTGPPQVVVFISVAESGPIINVPARADFIDDNMRRLHLARTRDGQHAELS